jgi:hypothetical protein
MFAGVCVRLPALADFASAMELEMALDMAIISLADNDSPP